MELIMKLPEYKEKERNYGLWMSQRFWRYIHSGPYPLGAWVLWALVETAYRKDVITGG